MPSFFNPAMNHGFPPTPPHVLGNRIEIDPPYYSSGLTAGYPARYSGGNVCEPRSEKFPQSVGYCNSHSAMPSQQMHPANISRDMKPNPLLSQLYAMNSGASLPPMRSNNTLPPMDSAIPPQYRRREQPTNQAEQRPKEQPKSTGGVAAHLDYDMDQMTDFVAEMAQGMYALYTSKIRLSDIDMLRSVYPGTTVPRQFRKYVYQILSSTRLPSSTILLGLYYLASRMRMLSTADVYASGNGEVYRMLTIALLLGSKFLDDNTFQNRSWSEVSNIPVADLNSMELDWLFAFDWKIHNRIHTQSDGFMTWKTHWETWRAKSDARVYDNRAKLAPIDTNIQRPLSISKPMLSPEGPIPPQYQRSGWLTPMSSDYSPPTASNTGPNTPDYFQAAAPWPFNNPIAFSRPWALPQQYMPTRSQPPSYQPTPSYQTFSPSVWTGHGKACGCSYCAKEHYLQPMLFGIQSVAG